jgi:hypothetical protein
MDTRDPRPTLIALATTLVAWAAIAGLGPVLVLERDAGPGADERLAIGLRAQALCVGVVAELDRGRLRVLPALACATCGART